MSGRNLQYHRDIRVVAQKRDPNQIGRTPRTDPGGTAYEDSDWALKANERSVAEICLY